MANYKIAAKERDLQNLSSSQIEGGFILYDEVSFRHWETLLNKWIDSINKFCFETNGNPPYIDNEMGNVGLLMSAAWQVGGIAVCEKLVELKGLDNKVRLDLWMKLPERGIEEFIEAKHTYHIEKLKKDKISRDKYDYSFLKEVVEDRAKKLEIEGNQRAVAIVFLTQNIKKYKPDNNHDLDVEEIKSLLKKVRLHDCDMMAWCFPKEMRKDNFPGVILSAKCVQTF